MSISNSKKRFENLENLMKHRSVVMPWDVLSVGASAADWWFCVYTNLVIYWICQYRIKKNFETMETWWNIDQLQCLGMFLSVGASAADWRFCVYINLPMYWIVQYLIVKKTLKTWKNDWNTRSVVMLWDVLSVGASAADWWCCAYINLVMYWLCQYQIVKKNFENMEK